MEAPEICHNCDLGNIGPICKHSGYGPDKDRPTDRLVPGPSCPFVLLAAKDAEIADELEASALLSGSIESLNHDMDGLRDQLAAKDAELEKMKTKLEESTRVLADCEGNESNSYGMVTRQIIENRAALKEVE